MSKENFPRREALALLCDDRIGAGVSRQVYTSRLLPDCVVKIESKGGYFQNVMEWEVWQRVKETKFAKWFAPCTFISPAGGILVMKRTTPIELKKLPDKVPAFLSDLKHENFGLLDGKLVCHDYGYPLLMETGMTTRMRKTNWS